MTTKEEWVAEGHILKEKCLVCKKRFKKGDKFIMCPIQEPSGDFIINSITIPIHTKCYYLEKK